MASEVKGWLRKRERADGMTWLWCYQRLRSSDGKMVENSIRLGLVSEIGDEVAAWVRVGKLRLIEKHINQPLSGMPRFGDLCTAYVKDGLPFRKKDWRRKGKGTIETYQYHINNLILPRWENAIAEEMKPLEIRNWLFGLHDGDDYHWETCSKTAGIMSLVWATGNPLLDSGDRFRKRSGSNRVFPKSVVIASDVRQSLFSVQGGSSYISDIRAEVNFIRFPTVGAHCSVALYAKASRQFFGCVVSPQGRLAPPRLFSSSQG
jgi:hypothetical protein